jgi:hypothetical protein
MTKVRRGDRVSVFCVKILSNSASWLLINTGWIPGDACQLSVSAAAVDSLPCEVHISHPSPGKESSSSAEKPTGDRSGGSSWKEQQEEMLWLDCLFTPTRCKGKSAPFRRHFKPEVAKYNPFAYDKSADNYSTVPL